MTGVPDERIARRAHIGPGRLIGVDLEAGKLYGEGELLDHLAATHPYGEWLKNTVELEPVIAPGPEPRRVFGEELQRRRIAAGYTQEDVELILDAMALDGKEAVGSMGDDTPLAVLSDQYRPISHYFRQNFSQVTNPPIDPLREAGVMSLRTRFKNLGNILAEEKTQTDVFVLESPFMTTGMYERMLEFFDAATVAKLDCTFERPEAGAARLGQGAARRARPAARRSRGGGARRRQPDRADRRGPGARSGRRAHGAGRRRRARAAGPRGAALVRVDHRARQRLHGRARLRRSGRRGRDRDQSLARPGGAAGPDGAGALQGPDLHPGVPELEGRDRGRPDEGAGAQGHLGHLLLSRRLRVRGGGPVAGPGGGVLPRPDLAHLGHRPGGPGEEGGRAAPGGVPARAAAGPGGRLLQAARGRRGARLRRQADPPAPGRDHARRLQAVQGLFGAHPRRAADCDPRPARLALGPAARAAGRGRDGQRDPQALPDPRHVARRPVARGARGAQHRHEPDRRALGLGRGRRGPRALRGPAERRQRQLRGQAGGLGPLRRHRRVPEPVPRDRDQGGPGRQARRGRPAARLQGHRVHRPDAAFVARA